MLGLGGYNLGVPVGWGLGLYLGPDWQGGDQMPGIKSVAVVTSH